MGHYIEVEKDINIYVEDIGKGKSVLFLHGWPVNHKMFEYQSNELPGKGIRFIGMDMRGYGKSDKPWEGYDYDRMADDVQAVIHQLKLDDITLVGFSMGGGIALRYMAKHNNRNVSKLVLAGAAAPSFTKRENYPFGLPAEEVNGLINAVYTDRPKMLADFGEMFFGSEISESLGNWFHGLGLEASAHGTIKSLEALRDEDLREDLAKVDAETAIFHGRDDQICSYDFAEIMNREIKNSRLIPFGNSGHATVYDEREKFNTELVRFVNS
ncbi:MAG TPA: alpha/beta hydrolase [Bacillales bacterium]|nr:alpha/beta hydrolase [Bacillales bacterium]